MSAFCTVDACVCFYYELDPDNDSAEETCFCGHVEDEHADTSYADFEEA